MNIAIVYSQDWAEHVAIEIFAIFKNNPAPVKVYHISDGPNQLDMTDMCQKFGEGYQVEYINAEELFAKKITSSVNVDSRFTKYALYRLLLPLLIHDDRLLYLDADAIVNGNLTELYNMDLGGCLVAGVIDSGAGADKYNLKAPLGLTDQDPYINGGVMLMDLKKIRSVKYVDLWLEEVNSTLYACHDQCIINKTCKHRIQVIDKQYNVSLSTEYNLDADEIKIMHYAGAKPWNTTEVPHYHIWQYWSKQYKHMFKNQLQQIIPKKIHYCWFGGRPKPPIVQKCIDSWARYLPEYEVKEWNESNFNVQSNPFTEAAYASGKMAFVTDYVRLFALWKYGGIYMDSDVEILKPLDPFLHHQAFTGHETDELMVTAIMGAVPKHEWIRMLLSHYHNKVWEATPNTQTITKLSEPFVQKKEDGFRYLQNGVVIYPVEVFCPYDHANLRAIPTDNSYAIHHFAGTWINRTIV